MCSITIDNVTGTISVSYAKNGLTNNSPESVGDTSNTGESAEDILNRSGDWAYDVSTGYGPFNSFYAAFDASGNMICHLNPNNLGQRVDGVDLSTIDSDWKSKYNIMWILPKIYITTENSGTHIDDDDSKEYTTGTIIMSSNSSQGYDLYPAFVSGSDSYDYLAIGVYECTQDEGAYTLASKTGYNPTNSNNRTLINFRDYAHYNMRNYSSGDVKVSQLWNYYQWQIYRICSLATMGSFDSQSKIGYGNASSMAPSITGRMDTKGAYYGIAGSDVNGVKLFIENSWGSMEEYIDDTYRSDFLYAGHNEYTNITSSTNHKSTVFENMLKGYGAAPYSTALDSWGIATTERSPDGYLGPDGIEIQGVGDVTVGGSVLSHDAAGISNLTSPATFNEFICSRLVFLLNDDPEAPVILTTDSEDYGTLRDGETESHTILIFLEHDNESMTVGNLNSVSIGSKTIDALPKPGYTFCWWGNIEGERVSDMTISPGTVIRAWFTVTVTVSFGEGHAYSSSSTKTNSVFAGSEAEFSPTGTLSLYGWTAADGNFTYMHPTDGSAGYTFDGWYIDDEKVGDELVITKPITIYAKFVKPTITIESPTGDYSKDGWTKDTTGYPTIKYTASIAKGSSICVSDRDPSNGGITITLIDIINESTKTIEFLPNSGHYLDWQWYRGESPISPTSVDGNLTLKISMSLKQVAATTMDELKEYLSNENITQVRYYGTISEDITIHSGTELKLYSSTAPASDPISNAKITIEEGGQLYVSVNTTFTNNAEIVNSGNITIAKKYQNTETRDGVLINNGTIINGPGATFNNLGSNNITNNADAELIATVGSASEIQSSLESSGVTKVIVPDGENIDSEITIPDGKELVIRGHTDSTASITVNGKLTISDTGELNNSASISNNGTISIDGLLENTGTITNNGAIDVGDQGKLDNSGILVNSSTGRIDNAGEIINSGTTRNDAGGAFDNTGNLSNTQSGSLDNKGTLTNNGTVSNKGAVDNSDGTITNYGSVKNEGALTNSSSILNDGTIENASGGTIDSAGTISNSSTGSIDNAGSLSNSGLLTNEGTVKNGSGLLENTGEVSNNGTLTNEGAVTNSGTIDNVGTLTNNGTIDSTNGTISGPGYGNGKVNVDDSEDDDNIPGNSSEKKYSIGMSAAIIAGLVSACVAIVLISMRKH